MKGKHSFKNIAYVIKTERKKNNISQLEMAKKLGLKNGQFISNIERGLCSLPLKSIAKTSKILNVAPKTIKQAIKLDFKETLNNFARD